MQKWVTTDFLNHTLRKNEGQVEQYYVENLHPTIIDRETWNAVQEELKRRNRLSDEKKEKVVTSYLKSCMRSEKRH